MKRLLVLLLWLAASPAALAAGAEVEARLWSPDLGGVARVDDGGAGAPIDLASDLGFAEEEVFQGRLVWRPSRSTSIRLDHADFSFAGDALLERTLSFAGATFELDALVASALDLEYGGLGFAWQPIATADGRLRLGPLIEARGLRGLAAIVGDVEGLAGLRASEEFEIGFATAGLVLDVEPSSRLHVYAEWKASVATEGADLTDAEAGVRFYPLEVLGLAVGYRRIEIDDADGDELFDLELDGPFFGAVLRY